MVPGFIGREMALASRSPILTPLRTSSLDYSASHDLFMESWKVGTANTVPITFSFSFDMCTSDFSGFSQWALSRLALQRLPRIHYPKCVVSLQLTDTTMIPRGSKCIRVKPGVFSYGPWWKQVTSWPTVIWQVPHDCLQRFSFMTNTRTSSVIRLWMWWQPRTMLGNHLLKVLISTISVKIAHTICILL